ncbi:hypothetical protein ACOZXQ_000556 [Cronobacter malonaticus]
MTDITKLTAKLKAAALAAGGEEWVPRDQTKNCGEYTVIVKGSLEKRSGWTRCRPVADEVVNKQTMKFIALANPAAVLELIAALESAEKRVAELEARTLTVKLPDDGMDDCYDLWGPEHCRNTFDCGYNFSAVRHEEAIREACAVAGIKLQIEGE